MQYSSDKRTVRAVTDYDMGLNPLCFSIYLRDDGELVHEEFEHFDAWVDWPEAERVVRTTLAKAFVELGWWA